MIAFVEMKDAWKKDFIKTKGSNAEGILFFDKPAQDHIKDLSDVTILSVFINSKINRELLSFKYMRHPQYAGFIAIIAGFLIQWPTFVTIIMAPVLIGRYIFLAKNEESDMLKQYPQEYRDYIKKVPAWIPRFA